MRKLIDYVRDKAVEEVDVDGKERLEAHRVILSKKKLLREVFIEFHHMFNELDRKYLSGEGKRIELGAGVCPIRETYPDVIASDIVFDPLLDMVLNAEQLDLGDRSVRALYGQNCFHHFPHPDKFFSELQRVLVDGGGAILLEPYYGPVASYLFKRLFKTEGFDKCHPSWETPSAGPMNGANQALSYIVFVRDRKEFERRYPNLRVVHQEICNNQFKYLLSGGLNFKQLIPNFMIFLVGGLQFMARPFKKWLGLHHIVVIQKVAP